MLSVTRHQSTWYWLGRDGKQKIPAGNSAINFIDCATRPTFLERGTNILDYAANCMVMDR